MYDKGEYDFAGFAVGAVERESLLDGRRIQPGHRLIGMMSSGLHSNGYSLVRKVVDRAGASLDRPFEENTRADRTLGQVLLEPATASTRAIGRTAKDLADCGSRCYSSDHYSQRHSESRHHGP
jgi:phosphoribosylformylglycinamidine cyclo-ligase